MERTCEYCKKPITGNSHSKIDGLFRKNFCEYCYLILEKKRIKEEKKVV